MSSYYKQIDGERYDRDLIELADQLSGSGAGTLGDQEVSLLLDHVKDGNSFTKIELKTIRYIGENYHCTPMAREMLLKSERS